MNIAFVALIVFFGSLFYIGKSTIECVNTSNDSVLVCTKSSLDKLGNALSNPITTILEK